MPRCKPKRFHKNRKIRVARRKKKIRDRVAGNPRNRKKRDKEGKVIKNEQTRTEESI